VLGCLASGQIRDQRPLSGTFRVQLSEEEVARLASLSAPGMRVTDVDLREGYLSLRSEAEVSGVRVPVGLEGGFTPRDGEVRFEPRRLEALGAPVPRRFTQDLLRGASLAYPVGLPFGEVSGVEVRESRLVLAGEVEYPPIGVVWVLVASPSSLWYLLLGLQVPEGELGGWCVSGNPS